MIEGARKLPTRHITIRVPWHDNGWRGTVCNNPCNNTSCLILPSIASAKDDLYETDNSGKSLKEIPAKLHPPCADEHVKSWLILTLLL